ncbi:hypothetical protein PPERSA_09868 [Pseudocohnilembus persalinus]|uniref:Uncharacterized protein n=1 Tax=Pseudocohnilembus persalinus TaxID=266149 RepID=A0A0V0QUS5_PSEPJ|nr:hypothetical protein PPERSA_09868 [Pseudocohnilembus persalinus]|eukprot:KRX05728.1 hypothetical protein PPERSA_09868 [Pseudocohnilembus persalinus]
MDKLSDIRFFYKKCYSEYNQLVYLEQKFENYNQGDLNIVLKIMQEFNQAGKLFAKQGKIEKSIQNYQVFQMLFNYQPSIITGNQKVKQLQNKFLLNYSILLIKQQQPLLALVFLNQINQFQNDNSVSENKNSKDILHEKININQMQINQVEENLKTTFQTNQTDILQNYKISNNNMNIILTNQEHHSNKQLFQVNYRKGICYKELKEDKLALINLINALQKAEKYQFILQDDNDKKKKILKLIDEIQKKYNK